jgi:hypothetical protein
VCWREVLSEKSLSRWYYPGQGQLRHRAIQMLNPASKHTASARCRFHRYLLNPGQNPSTGSAAHCTYCCFPHVGSHSILAGCSTFNFQCENGWAVVPPQMHDHLNIFGGQGIYAKDRSQRTVRFPPWIPGKQQTLYTGKLFKRTADSRAH